MEILNKKEIKQKITRLAYEIVEDNFSENSLIVAGINNNGYYFAKLLIKQIEKIKPIKITLTRIRLNPAAPLSGPIEIDLEKKDIKNKVILIVDDVANTGRTVFYAAKTLMDTLPKKVEVAVLVDRKHKSFPIQASYVGLSLATTLKENIKVALQPAKEMHVELD